MRTQIIALAFIALVASMGVASAGPADVVGWDTPYERCVYNQGLYQDKLDMLDSGFVGSAAGIRAFIGFYYDYYDRLTMKYAYTYNRILVHGF